MTIKKWSDDEDAIVRKEYSRSPSACAALLGRGIHSVHHRAWRLKINNRRPVVTWTDQDRKIVRDNWQNKRAEEISKLIPRHSASSIKAYAKTVLGLKRDRRWPPAERPDWFPIGKELLGALSSQEKAYLAGIFDGEGHINVQSKPGVLFTVKIEIVTTSVPLMKWIRDRVGHFTVGVRRFKVRGYRTQYHMAMGSPRKSISFLREVYPFLTAKKAEAAPLLGGYWHLSKAEKQALTHKVKRIRRAS